MALFVLNSDITIGDFRFRGVNEVIIKRSIHSISDTALIKIPSIARIIRNGKAEPEKVLSGSLFNEGDKVSIKLGYNRDLHTEFRGFVKRRNLDMPLEVECEGYGWLMKRNRVEGFFSGCTVKDLLGMAVSALDGGEVIHVKCADEINLSKVSLDTNSGVDVLNKISKYTDDSLSCFFIKPDTLWCGRIMTQYANGIDPFNGMGGTNEIKLRPGFNALSDTSLQVHDGELNPVLVIYSKKQSNGTRLTGSSNVLKGYVRVRNKVLNQIKDAHSLKLLANEKSLKESYTGYEGYITGFLQPFIQPGNSVTISDKQFPERNGTYLVERTEVHFGIKGARRKVELGPKFGFAKGDRQ